MAVPSTPIRAWFCGLELKDLKVQRSPYTQEPWFRSLVASIKADGLMSPIIVDNRNNVMRVAVGMNRVRAMRELGWEDSPAIVYGQLPNNVHGAIPTPTLELINFYLGDGEIYETHDGGLLLKGHHVPEKMIYPVNEEPYYG